jgi:hypothetical protein
MNSDTRLLPLNEALLGMIVSNDVLDTHGGLILGQGALVTEAILLSLQRRGIETLGIVSGKATVIDQDAEMERQRQRLVKLFRRRGAGLADKLLLQYVTQYRLEGRYG